MRYLLRTKLRALYIGRHDRADMVVMATRRLGSSTKLASRQVAVNITTALDVQIAMPTLSHKVIYCHLTLNHYITFLLEDGHLTRPATTASAGSE
jgi:hypothetical protein